MRVAVPRSTFPETLLLGHDLLFSIQRSLLLLRTLNTGLHRVGCTEDAMQSTLRSTSLIITGNIVSNERIVEKTLMKSANKLCTDEGVNVVDGSKSVRELRIAYRDLEIHDGG